jgi:hypothetical protein
MIYRNLDSAKNKKKLYPPKRVAGVCGLAILKVPSLKNIAKLKLSVTPKIL